jgi:hypothetical protein
MDDKKEFVDVQEAISRLPDGDSIHTFRQGGPLLIGAAWPRADIIEFLEAAAAIEVPGENAQSMGHGLAVHDEHGWLFIQTRPATDTKPHARDGLEDAGA